MTRHSQHILTKGTAERVEEELLTNENVYYMPHHAVVRREAKLQQSYVLYFTLPRTRLFIPA